MNRAKSHDANVACISDLEKLATAKLPRAVAEYINGGSMDNATYLDNISAYNAYCFLPRYLRDVTQVDASTICYEKRVKFPLGVGPSAMHKLSDPEGERATARACFSRRTNMILSTYSTTSIEEVSSCVGNEVKDGRVDDACPVAIGQQLSKVNDDSIVLGIIERASAAGCKALILTIDCPWLGRRLGDFRNNFSAPRSLPFPNFPPHIDIHNLTSDDTRIGYDTTLAWDKLAALKAKTGMQFWLKGVLTPHDAEMAVQAGVDGIIVSNHGGRQLDGAISTLDALPAIAAVVRKRIPIHFDGGIRRGSDIFKALALGADYTWLGRAVHWGLAYDGQRGVELALDILYDEFCTVMALTGCRSIAEIGPHLLARRGMDGIVRPLVPFDAVPAHLPTPPQLGSGDQRSIFESREEHARESKL